MRPMPFLVLVSAPALVIHAPAQEATVGQRLRTERPEIERLINELQPREALVKAEALLPASKSAFDKTNPQTMYMSYASSLSLSQAHQLAFKAALAAGQWEKALEYVKKAKEIAVENYTSVREPFNLIARDSKAVAEQTRKSLKEHESYIETLKAKTDPDPSDKQQLELVALEIKNIEASEKRAAAFEDFIKTAKADSEYYDRFVAFADKQLKDEAAQIEEYKAGKGVKTKWVEAIISNPSTYSAYTDKKDLLGFLYRLNVLDPENKKVLHQIDIVLGKATATPEKKQTKGKQKK
jgi:hypothetical protein